MDTVEQECQDPECCQSEPCTKGPDSRCDCRYCGMSDSECGGDDEPCCKGCDQLIDAHPLLNTNSNGLIQATIDASAHANVLSLCELHGNGHNLDPCPKCEALIAFGSAHANMAMQAERERCMLQVRIHMNAAYSGAAEYEPGVAGYNEFMCVATQMQCLLEVLTGPIAPQTSGDTDD